ncbi:two-component system sensor histidine kinase DesK [Luteibacter jiangsuensis]|uniref:Two-component system sensor histidine kinase DesK n=2 Tax=Luteibacter jiangsuensis TaxID=637577 RepID=A0ABT9T0X3_9GAMM|nr:two-component system sensor histidine kinase DesK [Luteibacter jiangsuensis]
MVPSWFQPTPDSLWNRYRDKPRLRIGSLFHLVWTVYVFGDLVFAEKLGPYWIPATAITFPMFLMLYGLSYVRPVREARLYAIAVALMGYATLKFNTSGGACYVIYACAMMGFDGVPKRCFIGIAAVIAGFMATAWLLLSWPFAVMATLSFIALSVGSVNVIYRFNAQRDAELKLSHDEVRRLAAAAERERIGRDLHDLLGHTLSLITLKLELSRRLLDRDAAAARREMEEAEQVAREALAEVRSAVTGIRASGVVAELAAARLLLNTAMIDFIYTSEMPVLPARVDAELALVLREAVTNIHRHAGASCAEVMVAMDTRACTMTVKDNGRGVDGGEGNGICGMRERVRALGGTLVFESSRQKGTVLRIEVPLTPADRLLSHASVGAPVALPLAGPGRMAS